MRKLLTNWLRKPACSHVWEEYKHLRIYEDDFDDMPISYKYLLICKKCGKVRVVKL